jgi:hypothetical protein
MPTIKDPFSNAGDGIALTYTVPADAARLLGIRLAKSTLRRNIPREELREALEMLGLAPTTDSAFIVPRDNLNRVRNKPHGGVGESPSAAESGASTARRCKKDLHDMAVHGKRRADNGYWFCATCAAATNKRNRQARREAKRAAA